MRRLRNGFTLIEVMIVVAIIALIVAIAYPSYLEHVARSKRAQAQAAIMKTLQLQERFYTVNGTYATNAQLPTLFGLASGATVHSGENAADADLAWYTIAVNNPAGCTDLTVCVNVIATPKAGYTDDNCGTLTQNTVGLRTESGTKDVAYCFK
jgi:type IV pilus assembly protein PilE